MSCTEARRRRECEEADCPVMRFCTIYWGKQCVRQDGNRVPRFKGHGSPYRQASKELERPVQVERIGTLGAVIWLAKPDEDEELLGELADDGPVRHPMQRLFDGAVVER